MTVLPFPEWAMGTPSRPQRRKFHLVTVHNANNILPADVIAGINVLAQTGTNDAEYYDSFHLRSETEGGDSRHLTVLVFRGEFNTEQQKYLDNTDLVAQPFEMKNMRADSDTIEKPQMAADVMDIHGRQLG